MIEKISASHLSTIQVVITGRSESDMTLKLSELKVKGVISGQNAEASVDPVNVYSLLSFIDALNLPKTIVPGGKPPRGQTKFILTYQDGHSIILGMNLNEEDVEYFELNPNEFQTLMDLWVHL